MKKIYWILSLSSIILFMACNNQETQVENVNTETQEVTDSNMDQALLQDINLSTLEEYRLVFPLVQSDLPYDYDALEPHFDKETMMIHHDKHHAGYTSKLNTALEGQEYQDLPLFEIFQTISMYPEKIRNLGGGYYNHELFWKVLTPEVNCVFEGEVADAINSEFGSFDEFQKLFNEKASSQFGSGWAWLSVDTDGKLFVSNTSNQDNPLMDICDQRGIPVLCLDVWEHSYYLKFQNKRTDYISEFWNIVNWKEVNKRYLEALKGIK